MQYSSIYEEKIQLLKFSEFSIKFEIGQSGKKKNKRFIGTKIRSLLRLLSERRVRCPRITFVASWNTDML